MDGFAQTPNGLRQRDANKFASTNVTNEIVAALSTFGIGNVEAPARGYRYAPYVVVSSTSVGTNQWEYTVSPVVASGSTYTGTAKIAAETYKARNRWEELPKAGYSSTGVTALLPIPVDAPIDAYPSERSGALVLLFTERNEPSC